MKISSDFKAGPDYSDYAGAVVYELPLLFKASILSTLALTLPKVSAALVG